MKAVLAALVFAAGPALAQPPDFTALAREAGAAVVRVMGSAPPVITEYGPPPEPQLGSGLVIDASGYILTNAHLVSAAPEVAVRVGGVHAELPDPVAVVAGKAYVPLAFDREPRL